MHQDKTNMGNVAKARPIGNQSMRCYHERLIRGMQGLHSYNARKCEKLCTQSMTVALHHWIRRSVVS